MQTQKLRTEYLTNPKGIDIVKPRFFWVCRKFLWLGSSVTYGDASGGYAMAEEIEKKTCGCKML